jgi:hypothetical protein
LQKNLDKVLDLCFSVVEFQGRGSQEAIAG